MSPSKLGAKEFENLVLESGRRSRLLTISRYGVSVSLIGGEWRPIPSLPDFDGVMIGGNQFVMEAKCWSQASIRISKDLVKPRQIKHMLERSAFGVPCYLLIHWNERVLKTKTDPSFTVAIPVSYNDERFVTFSTTKEPQGSISREESLQKGELIEWKAPRGCRKLLPDFETLLGLSTPDRQGVLI